MRYDRRNGKGGEIGPGHLRGHLVLEHGARAFPHGAAAGARDLAPDPGRCPENSPLPGKGGSARREASGWTSSPPYGRGLSSRLPRSARAPHTRTRARDRGPRGKDSTRGGEPRAPKKGRVFRARGEPGQGRTRHAARGFIAPAGAGGGSGEPFHPRGILGELANNGPGENRGPPGRNGLHRAARAPPVADQNSVSS